MADVVSWVSKPCRCLFHITPVIPNRYFIPSSLLFFIHNSQLALISGCFQAELPPNGHKTPRLGSNNGSGDIKSGLAVQTTGATSPFTPVRQIRHRDRGCRFPGCERTRWTHSHHRIHWAQGGPTDLDNLITLCPHHHRLAHEAAGRSRATLMKNCDSFVPMEEPSDTTRRRLPPTGGISSWPT